MENSWKGKNGSEFIFKETGDGKWKSNNSEPRPLTLWDRLALPFYCLLVGICAALFAKEISDEF